MEKQMELETYKMMLNEVIEAETMVCSTCDVKYTKTVSYQSHMTRNHYGKWKTLLRLRIINEVYTWTQLKSILEEVINRQTQNIMSDPTKEVHLNRSILDEDDLMIEEEIPDIFLEDPNNVIKLPDDNNFFKLEEIEVVKFRLELERNREILDAINWDETLAKTVLSTDTIPSKTKLERVTDKINSYKPSRAYQARIRARMDGTRCRICSKQYKKSGSLREHIRGVHLKRGFTCKLEGCRDVPRKFATKNRLIQHLKRMHYSS